MSRRKSTSIWYPEYPGDYGRKTSHLSLAEHGAYKVLRDHYYSTGRALPTNVDVLYRICRAFEGSDRAAVDAVVAEFFTLEPDGYHNGRCDEELAKRDDIREKRIAAVNSRADRQAKITPTNEVTSVTTSTSTPIEKEREAKASLVRVSRFAEFWDAYPHRDGRRNRKGAEGKYQAAVRSGVPEQTIIDGARRAHGDRRVTAGYARDPTTWLNQQGWLDEIQAAEVFPLKPEKDSGRPSRSDQRLDAFLRGAAG